MQKLLFILQEFVTLKERLYWACGGQSRTQRQAPKCPFAVEKLGSVGQAAAPAYQQLQQRDARTWSQSSQSLDVGVTIIYRIFNYNSTL